MFWKQWGNYTRFPPKIHVIDPPSFRPCLGINVHLVASNPLQLTMLNMLGRKLCCPLDQRRRFLVIILILKFCSWYKCATCMVEISRTCSSWCVNVNVQKCLSFCLHSHALFFYCCELWENNLIRPFLSSLTLYFINCINILLDRAYTVWTCWLFRWP